MKLRKLALACAAIPAALFLTGCGSDDSSSSSGVQVYSNGFGGTGETSLPVNYYSVNGGSYSASSANPVLANLYNSNGIVAGSEVTNALPIDSRIAFIGANIDPVSGSGALVTVNYAVGSNNALSDRDVTAVSNTAIVTTYVGQATVGMHTASGQTRPFVVLTGPGINGFNTNGADGSSLGVIVPSGTTFDGSATVAEYSLATSGGTLSNSSYNTIAISSSTTAQVNPVVYMADVNNAEVQACTLAFTGNFVPFIAETGPNECVNKDLIGDNTNLAAFIYGLAVTQNGANVLVVGYDNIGGNPGNSTIWNCPAAGWSNNLNCTAVSVTYPDNTTGQQIGQIYLNANRDTILIETLTTSNTGALVSCSINADGTSITNCQLPRLDGSSTGAVLDINDNQNLVY
jgi:hypothetical protein